MQAKTSPSPRVPRVNFCGCLAISLVLVGLMGARASDDSYGVGKLEPSHAYRSLETLDGREFFDVRIVQVDPGGLLFRHRGGAGKVMFSDLPAEWGKRYGHDEKSAKAIEAGRPEMKLEEGFAWASEHSAPPFPVITLTYRVRTTLPPVIAPAPSGCGASLASFPWHSHWSRFHPGLAYPLFPCRQLAERDFLISSGILPRPPGVGVWRLR